MSEQGKNRKGPHCCCLASCACSQGGKCLCPSAGSALAAADEVVRELLETVPQVLPDKEYAGGDRYTPLRQAIAAYRAARPEGK